MIAPTLIGDKVTLRPISKSEMLYCRKWGRNPRIKRFILQDFGNASDEEQLKFWRKTRRSATDLMWSIHENSTARYIGNCGLHKIDSQNLKAELGIFIGEENLHSRGLGTETVKIIRDYAFQELKLNRVYLDVFVHNPRAIHCYEKANFQHEGTLRKNIKKGNKYLDVEVMSVLKSEWKTLTQNGKKLNYTYPKN